MNALIVELLRELGSQETWVPMAVPADYVGMEAKEWEALDLFIRLRVNHHQPMLTEKSWWEMMKIVRKANLIRIRALLPFNTINTTIMQLDSDFLVHGAVLKDLDCADTEEALIEEEAMSTFQDGQALLEGDVLYNHETEKFIDLREPFRLFQPLSVANWLPSSKDVIPSSMQVGPPTKTIKEIFQYVEEGNDDVPLIAERLVDDNRYIIHFLTHASSQLMAYFESKVIHDDLPAVDFNFGPLADQDEYALIKANHAELLKRLLANIQSFALVGFISVTPNTPGRVCLSPGHAAMLKFFYDKFNPAKELPNE